jgi:hypothetical protein
LNRHNKNAVLRILKFFVGGSSSIIRKTFIQTPLITKRDANIIRVFVTIAIANPTVNPDVSSESFEEEGPMMIFVEVDHPKIERQSDKLEGRGFDNRATLGLRPLCKQQQLGGLGTTSSSSLFVELSIIGP